jgi:CBS domain-containing protein
LSFTDRDAIETQRLLQGSELTKAQELVYELSVRQVMTRSVVCVSPAQTMQQLGEVLRQAGINGAPVLDGDRLVGIVSLLDLIRSLEHGRPTDPVREWMSVDVLTVREDDSVIEAVKAFARRPVGRIPVVNDEGRLVGIVTGGDITRGLVRALDLGYREEEISRYRASHIFQDISSEDTSLTLRYSIRPRDFARSGEASGKIKRALLRLGGRPETVRRIAVASYEAEMNLVIHTDRGGEILAEVRPERVSILATDDGPGIEDVEAALRPGFSTAPDWIRDLGFGAGMGLQNIRRCADEMSLESQVGVGTRLEAVIFLGEGNRLGRNRV